MTSAVMRLPISSLFLMLSSSIKLRYSGFFVLIIPLFVDIDYVLTLNFWRGPSNPLLFSFRFLRCCFGPRSRMRRRVQTWLSSQSTLTTWAIGKTEDNKRRATTFCCQSLAFLAALSDYLGWHHTVFSLFILQGPLFDNPAGESPRQREAASQVH